MKDKKLQLSIQADLDLVSKTSETERVLEIEVRAPEAENKQERLPLNLAIVLDRSGSMAGEKVEYVKQAAIHLLDLLEEQDRAAVVIFNSSVDVLSTSIPMTDANRNGLKKAILRVGAQGGTFLSGGWLAGCEAAARAVENNTVNRVLLLTDGEANEGIVDMEELAKQAGELNSRSISTSTFGVGMGFNEHLLEGMSNQGGGKFYFIESPEDIPNIFQQEFKDMAAVTARDVEVTLDIPATITAHVPGNWREARTNNQLRISLGSMYSGREQILYVQLTVPPSEEKNLAIQGVVRGKGENGELLEAKTEVVFKYASKRDVEKAAPKADLLERFSAVAMAAAAAEALRMDKEGRRQEGLDHLNNMSSRHRTHMSAPQSQSYYDLHSSMSAGLSEADHKHRHQEMYNLKFGRRQGEEFDLHQPGGHIVIEVEGKMVLIDTGSPVSIGREKQLNFLGKEFPLIPSFQNVVDMEMLSDKVGIHLDVLMGTDILRQTYFTIDARHKRVTFSLNPMDWNVYHRIPLKNFLMGVPSTSVTINGQAIDLFVDTGAVRCYIPKEIAAGFMKVGTAKDFYPGSPDFITPLYQAPVDLSGETITLECGVVGAELLSMGLDVMGVRGILGMDLANKFVLGFNLAGDELILIQRI